MRIFSATLPRTQLVLILMGFIPFTYFELYLNVLKWCMERPNYHRTMSGPPTGLFGCMHDRFQEVGFTFVSLFWFVLFFVAYKLIKGNAKPKKIIITFICCYIFGAISYSLIVGFLAFG